MIDDVEHVILVSESDEAIGEAKKLEAHRLGLLHRAFSVFVLDDDGRVLLQRRARSKYHSPGLWSNTCCGHPRPGERTIDAASRRLREEMGIECDLFPVFSFRYRAELDSGLVEHEVDHVFIGRSMGAPRHDPGEVDEWRWMRVDQARAWSEREPQSFTAWFPAVFTGLLPQS
jgi:isopentenyl-diphosphate delta-isomerase